MKKYAFLSLVAVLLCSCAKSETISSNSVIQEEINFIEPTYLDKPDYTFNVNENKVDVMCSNKIVQTLECDYLPDKKKLVFKDYDFDGFEDLFISMDCSAMFASGTYFRYNPETLLYEKWDELNKIGAEMIVIEDTSALRQKISSDYWLEYYDYKWENDALMLFEHRISETGAVMNTYSVDKNGNEILINSETFSDSTHDIDLFDFVVTENGIEIMKDSHIIQTVEGSFLEELSRYNDIGKCPEEFLVTEDYDFDGYADLFVPTLIGRPNTPGIYYQYNPQTRLFEEWDELNTIGCLMYLNDDNTLTNHISISAVDHKSITYKWDNQNLKEISRETQYTGADGEVYIDTYEYHTYSRETLVKREQVIHDENNNWIGTIKIEFPAGYSFSVHVNSIDIFNNNDKIVQKLDCSPISENMFIINDYNFDGYNDLFIITDIKDVKLSGLYYKFNPETLLFEKWDELNKFGCSFDTGISSNLMNGKILFYDNDKHERFIYKWENDKLILIEKRKTIIDKNNNKAIMELYYIDSDGNETLIDNSELDLNEYPLDFE